MTALQDNIGSFLSFFLLLVLDRVGRVVHHGSCQGVGGWIPGLCRCPPWSGHRTARAGIEQHHVTCNQPGPVSTSMASTPLSVVSGKISWYLELESETGRD